MEIVIENPSAAASSSASSPSFPQSRPCRASYTATEGVTPSLDYYNALQPSRPRSRLMSPEPEFDAPIPTSVRRVDRSGLLEIADPEQQQQQQRLSRPRHLTGSESHAGTLTRRVDRSGLLEAVPELPDACPSGWRTPDKSSDRKSIGEAAKDDRPVSLEPPSNDQRSRISPTSLSADATTISSPYLRRYPGEDSSLERPTPTSGTNGNSFASVSPSSSLTARARQSYVDLTGATYTRSLADSPIAEGGEKKPDCIGRSSPRSRDRQSPLTMSAIPDVIEAHGSRVVGKKDEAPEGQRAEAEGCERSANDGHEENSRGAFKGPNKILHNDNIQTLRVIILSEQL